MIDLYNSAVCYEIIEGVFHLPGNELLRPNPWKAVSIKVENPSDLNLSYTQTTVLLDK